MASFRSARIEALLGAPVDQVTETHVQGLVTGGAVEDFDLDFKAERYGNSDKDKRDLAGDVAAMANTAGGVIVIGIQEDQNARAGSAPGVALSDDEARRMTQILGSISPKPIVDIRAVPSDNDSNWGYFLVAVPRSPVAPHAVPVNEGLRYPKRSGSTTRYLSEPEVAQAYRDRDRSQQSQTNRLDEITADAVDRLDRSKYAWLVVSLMPELAGDLEISSQAFNLLKSELLNQQRPLVQTNATFLHATVGRRRYLLGGGPDHRAQKYIAADLHTDGGGAFAVWLGDMRRNQPQEPGSFLVSDESVTAAIINGLLTLAAHSRDRARAGGTVLARATLLAPAGQPIEIGAGQPYGFTDSISTMPWSDGAVPPAEISATLDDITVPGVSMLQASRLLADQLGQVFGIAEMKQIGADGTLHLAHWSGGAKGPVAGWAHNYSLPTR